MWKIHEVKEKGRLAFKANYWLCVLVALIIALISGGLGGTGFKFGGGVPSGIFNRDKDAQLERDYDSDLDDYFEGDYDYDYEDDEKASS